MHGTILPLRIGWLHGSQRMSFHAAGIENPFESNYTVQTYLPASPFPL
jgi:hypothetical protein